MPFDIQLDTFRGPIDLLHYLVRRHEVDISEIALAKVTEQYFEFIDVLKEISFDHVGQFLDVASRLIEIKARAVLPRNEHEPEENLDDPREDLVHRLLMYKEFKDAASLLDEHSMQWQNRYARMQDDLPARKVELSEQPIEEVELWDLVSAFGRILRDNRPKLEKIVYDDTPIHVYMKRIHSRLVNDGSLTFSQLFEPGMHKSAMIGVFLAVLELTRHHNVRAEQPDIYAEIKIQPAQDFSRDLDVAGADEY